MKTWEQVVDLWWWPTELWCHRSDLMFSLCILEVIVSLCCDAEAVWSIYEQLEVQQKNKTQTDFLYCCSALSWTRRSAPRWCKEIKTDIKDSFSRIVWDRRFYCCMLKELWMSLKLVWRFSNLNIWEVVLVCVFCLFTPSYHQIYVWFLQRLKIEFSHLEEHK